MLLTRIIKCFSPGKLTSTFELSVLKARGHMDSTSRHGRAHPWHYWQHFGWFRKNKTISRMHFEGYKFAKFTSDKVVSVVPATLQGFDANYVRVRNPLLVAASGG